MTAYYNELDPFAAAWLRELIAEGLIAPGDVDTRSIVDVRPGDLAGYRQCHFFAGIGGWSYAARLAGIPDEHPIWTGSCPCQPFSAAGKRKGAADERHLWPVWFDLVRQCRPDVVFGEQVESAVGMGWLDGVRADLEGEGYALGAAVLGAHSVGAPHIRQRLWWVADAHGGGRDATRQFGDVDCVYGSAAVERGEASQSDLYDGRLADADGRLAGHGHLQPGGQHGQQPQDGGAGGLEHAPRDGRQQRRAEPGGRGAAGGCGDGRLGDADNARPQGRIVGRNGAGERPAGAPGVGGFWSRAEWLACSDGKARRVESGIQPLAHGVPNRVGTLRGAGNAIVPETAAQFIAAYIDVVGHQ